MRGVRDEDFANIRLRCEMLGDVDSRSGNCLAAYFAQPCMQSGFYLEARWTGRLNNGARTANGAHWPIEGGGESIRHCRDATVEPFSFSGRQRVQAITLAAGVFRLDRKYRREHRISVR